MSIIKIGVIGCGSVAQWMHLPFLTELPGFQVTAVCDISPKVAEHVARKFQVEQSYTDYHLLLEQADVDAVLVATTIHSDIAVAAARAGKHVLTEKPMACNLAEAEAMVEAADSASVILMVAYMKRYDPGYRYGRRLMQEMEDVRLIRVHDFCGPNSAIIDEMTTTFRDPHAESENLPALRAELRRRHEAALGPGLPEGVYRAYSLVGGLASHDITILRGAFGSPRAVTHTELRPDGSMVLSTFDYGDGRLGVFEIGGMSRKGFDEELSAFGAHNTVRIRFPSPFIKYAPTLVETIHEEEGAVIERTVAASYEESFRRELEHFQECVVENKVPETSGRDSLEDVRLQTDIIKAALR